MRTRKFPRQDFSAGIQSASTPFLRQPNEVEDARNVRFNEVIGAIFRRNGYISSGSKFSTTNKKPTGFHTAQFTTGAKKMVACNNDTGTNTLVRVQASDGTWTTIISDLPPNADVYFCDYRDEVYVSGVTTADEVPFQPRNIDKTLNVSTTRNLLFAPRPKYFVVYRGLLYAANVLVGTDRYPDRIYKSSPPTGAITFVRGPQTGTLTSLNVDSTRFLKVGMLIDIYDRKLGTKKYSLTITAVDKVANTISFASTAITLANNDEIYLDGRYGILGTFWNTDYPTPDKADWSAVQPGTDSSNAITGVRESANRLFVFTLNSANRFDGTNMVAFLKSIGCVSHRTIQNIDDDWMIWLTARGRVYARNESGGQQEYISRGVANKFFQDVLDLSGLTQLKSASAGITDGEYTVYVGDYKGEPHRAVYDFGSNTWSIDALSHPSYMYANDSSSGAFKPYFVSDNGDLFQDDTGDEDGGKAIRFDVIFGRTNYGTEGDKQAVGAYVYAQNAIGLKLSLSIDDAAFTLLGEIKKNYGQIDYINKGRNSSLTGSMFNLRISGAVKGPAQSIESIIDYFNVVDEVDGHGKQS